MKKVLFIGAFIALFISFLSSSCKKDDGPELAVSFTVNGEEKVVNTTGIDWVYNSGCAVFISPDKIADGEKIKHKNHLIIFIPVEKIGSPVSLTKPLSVDDCSWYVEYEGSEYFEIRGDDDLTDSPISSGTVTFKINKMNDIDISTPKIDALITFDITFENGDNCKGEIDGKIPRAIFDGQCFILYKTNFLADNKNPMPKKAQEGYTFNGEKIKPSSDETGYKLDSYGDGITLYLGSDFCIEMPVELLGHTVNLSVPCGFFNWTPYIEFEFNEDYYDVWNGEEGDIDDCDLKSGYLYVSKISDKGTVDVAFNITFKDGKVLEGSFKNLKVKPSTKKSSKAINVHSAHNYRNHK